MDSSLLPVIFAAAANIIGDKLLAADIDYGTL